MKSSLALIMALSLVACSTQLIDKETSSLYSIPLGSVFELHQALVVPAYHARAFIQDGKIVSEQQVREYYPHCEVELKNVKPVSQRILPNRFTLVRVLDDEYEARRHILFASLKHVEGGPLFVGFASEYYVQPEQPSDVFKITCLHWDEYSANRFLSVKEIRQALGSVMSLQIKDDAI